MWKEMITVLERITRDFIQTASHPKIIAVSLTTHAKESLKTTEGVGIQKGDLVLKELVCLSCRVTLQRRHVLLSNLPGTKGEQPSAL